MAGSRYVAFMVYGFALLTSARGSAPQSTCVQGYLEDLSGNPVDGSVTFEVCIYDALAGGNIVWPLQSACAPSPPCCREMPGVPVSDGLFALCFGDNDLTPQVFGPTSAGPQPRWLEIRTFGEPMIPRIELHSAPYSFRTGFVDNPELTDRVELGSGTGLAAGSMKVFNGASPSPTIVLDGDGNAAGGAMRVFNSAGSETIIAVGDVGNGASEIHLLDPGGGRVEFSAHGGGDMSLRNIQGQPTVRLGTRGFDGPVPPEWGGSIRVMRDVSTSARIDIVAAWDGSNTDPYISMLNDNGSTTMVLRAGAPSEGARIEVRSSGGANSIVLNGATGKVCATTFSTTGGCDVAEAFELSEREKIKPGMVMVLDEARPGHLTVSTRACDTKVAGIVSGAGGLKPGVVLGGGEPRTLVRADVLTDAALDRDRTSAQAEACGSLGTDVPGDGTCGRNRKSAQAEACGSQSVDNSDLPIALSGRVYCFVDATQQAVAVGDLLTTSDTPGHAMKVTDFARSQGAVLGKAMEPLEKGKEGLVLVLVALQ